MTPDEGFLSRSHIPGDDPEPNRCTCKWLDPYLASLTEGTLLQL
jgi:hypothetical protein